MCEERTVWPRPYGHAQRVCKPPILIFPPCSSFKEQMDGGDALTQPPSAFGCDLEGNDELLIGLRLVVTWRRYKDRVNPLCS